MSMTEDGLVNAAATLTASIIAHDKPGNTGVHAAPEVVRVFNAVLTELHKHHSDKLTARS